MAAGVLSMKIRDTPQLENTRSTLGMSDITSSSSRQTGATRACVGDRDNVAYTAENRVGWTSSAIGMVGGVAGTVLGICYNAIPRISTGDTTRDQDFESWQRSAKPLPGMFPEDDSRAETENTPMRPSKRMQVSPSSEWVMVNDATPELPIRLSSKTLTSTEPVPSPQPTASRASYRRPMTPRSRKSISVSHAFAPPPAIASPSLAVAHRRRASLASTRSPAKTLRARSSMQHIAPRRSIQDLRASSERDTLSPEAHVLLQRREKTERRADKTMRQMSRQVQDLIRQGQQALGTDFKMEFEEDIDEGIDLDEHF